MVERKKLISMVRGAQQGDDEAAAELYDVFYSDIYYHIMKTVNDPELAADLTQDTFIEILATIGKLEEPAAFVTWAKQIAYHRCTAYFRKSHELLADEDEDGYSVFDTIEEDRDEFIPGEALDKEDLKKAIHDMINDLPPEQRSALLMRYFEEVSVKEIAEIQGVTEGTVKSRLNYARKAVKQSVEEYEKKHDIKLHSVGILPLLLWLFGQYQKAGFSFGAGAAATATGATAAGATATGTGTATATGATAATATTAGTTTAGAATATGAAATAASTASTAAAVGVAGATAGTASTAGTAAAVGTALATKIVAGIVAAVVAVGGATTAVVVSKNSAEQTSPTISTVQTVPTEEGSEQIEELEFTLSRDRKSYEVTGIGTFEGSELVIPAEHKGLPVTALSYDAFKDCGNLVSVVIPNSVTRISGDTFRNCPALVSITVAEGNPVYHSAGNCIIETASKTLVVGCRASVIPNDGSVTIIDSAFMDCAGLDHVNIPDTITHIGTFAFYGCKDLLSIHIPASVTQIGERVFGDCASLNTITVADGNPVYHSAGNCIIETATKTLVVGCKGSIIPTDGSVTTIGDSAFFYSTSLRQVNIPDTVTRIGSSAFFGCRSLSSLHIPASVTEIGHFLGESYALTSLTVAEGNPVYHSAGDCIISTAEKYLIAGCNSSVIPDDGSVVHIGESAFDGLPNLTSVAIPEGVTTIGNLAFIACTGLKNVSIPSTVNSIGQRAFEDCAGLADIYYFGTREQWNAINKGNNWDAGTGAYVIHCTDGNISKDGTPTPESKPNPEPEIDSSEGLLYVLSDDGTYYEVNGIGTFKGTELVIPAEYNGVPVKAIKERAFYECKQLTSVSIPGSVESIGGRAFQLCENIESLTLSEGIQRIEGGAFSKCYALTSIHIPASVTDIGSFAFDMCFGAEQITVATDNAVYHSSGNCLIDTAEKSIIAACGNSVIPTDGSVDKIGEGGFNGYDNETLVLPNCITSIGDSAFSGSTIKEVVIPGSVTTMGTYIFSGCTSLTTATFEEGVTGINSAAFSYCPSLHAVYIPVSALYIDSSAFSLCESLSDVYYAGTMAQWRQILDIPLLFTVHCTDGDIPKS